MPLVTFRRFPELSTQFLEQATLPRARPPSPQIPGSYCGREEEFHSNRRVLIQAPLSSF